MQFQLILLLDIIWNIQTVRCRPQNLFLDSINQPVGNEVDLFSPEGSGDQLDTILNPVDLALSSDLTSGEYITDASIIDSDDLFSAEGLALKPIPSLQSSSACGTDVDLTMMDVDVPQLQARDDALCGSSDSKEDIDAVVNLLTDPESWLREKIPAANPPTGQINQAGPNNEYLNFESVKNRQPIPGLFEDDDQTCRRKVFGLSIIPVCHDDLRNPMTQYPAGYADLFYVDPCMLLSVTFWLRNLYVEQYVDSM